ncbi:MAG TPA: hypothetical protein DCZ69_05650 [Syntrophobacteraceae bacterium]|nr:hypothetical protein [Syntrophobacteraceae bacterium]
MDSKRPDWAAIDHLPRLDWLALTLLNRGVQSQRRNKPPRNRLYISNVYECLHTTLENAIEQPD